MSGSFRRTRREDKKVWHLTIGDSAEAWAKAVGKLLALKESVDTVILDFSEVRAAGIRLKGYGWISSGDETIATAFAKIVDLLNSRAGQLLTRIDILDLLNHLGTTLSSRRSAEIALMPVTDAEIDSFISAKKDFWLYDNAHRQQSNNSIVFWNKPTNWELRYIFDKMVEAGGSEPGFINGEAAKKRAPWFKGVNPCAEILLGNKSFCNLVEVDWGKFRHDFGGLQSAVRLAARANYRQTCVDLDDGVLQRSWHELNEFLRLCGVGATGIVKFLDFYKGHNNLEDMVKVLRREAQKSANSMADELGLPRPKAVTTIKPSGTLSKIMDTTEGVHKPLGKYLFNNITFSKHDEIIPTLRQAGYKIVDKPFEPDSVLVTFPVAYEDVEFDVVDGKEVNLESAITQLERYKFMMEHYVDHNCSVTISYDKDEVMCRDERRHLRGQPHTVAQECLLPGRKAVRLQRRQCRHRSAQHVHRVAVLADADDVENRIRHRPCCAQLCVKVCKFLRVRQFALHQQVAHLFERGMLGQIMDRIAPILQRSSGAVDVAHPGPFEIDALQASVDLDVISH